MSRWFGTRQQCLFLFLTLFQIEIEITITILALFQFEITKQIKNKKLRVL